MSGYRRPFNRIQWSIVKPSGGSALAYHPIGHDGLPRPDIGPALERYWIGPGSRFEILLTAPKGATAGESYEIVWCESSTDIYHSPTDTIEPDSECTGTRVVVATLEVVAGSAETVAFAAGDAFTDVSDFGLVSDLWALDSVDIKRTIKFTQSFDPDTGTTFAIDIGDGVGDRHSPAQDSGTAPAARERWPAAVETTMRSELAPGYRPE